MNEPNRERGGANLAEYVVYDVKPAEVDRQWSAIAARVRTTSPSRPWLAYAAVAVLAAVLAVVVQRALVAPSPSFAGTTIESGLDGQVVTLSDASEIRLAP